MSITNNNPEQKLGANEKSSENVQNNGTFSMNLYHHNEGYTETEGEFRSKSGEFRAFDDSDFTIVDKTSKDKRKICEDVHMLGSFVKNKVTGTFTKKTLYRRLPILNWLPKYDMNNALGDLVAGLTVGLTLIPQGLAFSNIVKVPVEYGLYGSFIGAFVYIIFGSCKDVPIGPSAILSITVYQTVGKYGLQHIILTTFFAGVVQILMGIFGLGFIIDFISGPVSTGFTSAAALIILTSQVKDILGIEAAGSTFVNTWDEIIRNIHNANIPDAVVGVGCIAALLLLRMLGNKQFRATNENCEPNSFIKVINKVIWLVGISRNALCVVISGFISYKLSLEDDPPFHVIGHVPKGLPEFKLPPFGYTEIGKNGTTTEHSFGQMMSDIGSGVLVVALIALLEDIAVCKAFSNGNPIDATQEFIAVGLCNIANSFFQSFAINGPLARGAVNNASGVKTTLAGLYAGTIVIVSLLFFTPYFRYIPKATLAGVIIAAVIFMVEIKVTKSMWRTKRSCFFVALVTFVACLVLPLELGIVVGIGLNLLFILYHAARPKITLEKLTSSSGIDYLQLTPDRSLVFPSMVYVRKLVNKFSIAERVPVVIDCSHIYSADYTAAQAIESLTKDFASRKQPLFFYNIKPSVSSVFQGLEPKDLVMYYNADELDDLLTTRCPRMNGKEVSNTKC